MAVLYSLYVLFMWRNKEKHKMIEIAWNNRLSLSPCANTIGVFLLELL